MSVRKTTLLYMLGAAALATVMLPQAAPAHDNGVYFNYGYNSPVYPVTRYYVTPGTVIYRDAPVYHAPIRYYGYGNGYRCPPSYRAYYGGRNGYHSGYHRHHRRGDFDAPYRGHGGRSFVQIRD